jgi:outer membrane receptor protein involved in Fe transport
MKFPRALLAVLTACFVAATAAEAQTASAPRPSRAEDPSAATPAGEVVSLSPFEVSASADKGYAAASTLAGSRMNTELRNTAASISVFTKDFLRDIGANSLNDAVAYSLNGGEEYTVLTGLGPRNANVNVQLRGFIGATLTRNFFPLGAGGGDIYNTERLDFSRGPNSILFGTGSPGGVLNTTSKRARFGRPIHELGLRVGSWDDFRATVDVGQQVSDKVSVRINGVRQQKRSWRDFENQNRTAGAFAATYRPFRQTEVRVDAEFGKGYQVLANPFRTGDKVSAWLAAGKPISANNTTVVGGTQASAPNTLSYDPYGITGPTVWRTVQQTSLALPVGSNSLIRRSFTDESVLPRASNVFGPGSWVNYPYHNYSAFLEQRWGKLTAELAYNRQVEHRTYIQPLIFNVANLQGDPNALLPSWPLPNGQLAPNSGRPNPNVGKFFVESSNAIAWRDNTVDNYRATVAYELDLKRYSAWLGSHRLAGLASRSEGNNFTDTLTEVNVTPPGTATYPLDVTNANNVILRRTYIDFTNPDSRWHGQHDPALFPINNLNGVTSGYRRTSNAHVPASSRTDTRMVASQSSWWQDRIYVTAGLRRDELETYGPGTVILRAPVTGEFLRRSLLPTPSLVAAGTTQTAGGVFHAFRWLSLIYNRANNFVPQTALDVYGQPIGAVDGKGEDAGIRLTLWDGKVNLTVMHYETTRENQVLNIANNLPLRNYMNGIWDALGRPESLVNQQSNDTVSNAGKGWEVELIANPTRQWRLSANYSQTNINQTATFLRTGAYIEANRALWTQNLNRPLVTNIGIGGSNLTVRDALAAVDTTYAAIRQSEGTVPLQNVKHAANIFSTYTFAAGPNWLRGLMIGGGANYRGKSVAGYSTVRNGAPIYAPGYTLVNAVASRTFRLNRQRTVQVQLNVNNLLENDQRLFLDGDDGGFHIYRFQQPRSWGLSATVNF